MPFYLVVWLTLVSGHSCWGLELYPIYSDGMVVQQNRPIVVRGTAQPGKEISLELRANRGSASSPALAHTRASDSGDWQAEFPARTPEDSPLSLVAKSGQIEKTIKDICVGDVWLCAGQSNMNFLMRPNPPWSEGVLDWENEVRAANDEQLRFFTVVPEASHTQQEKAYGLWRPASPTFAGYLSAVPFYFGKRLRDATAVPVGVIVSALGGTSIREWSDPADVQDSPDDKSALARHAALRKSNVDAVERYYAEVAAGYRQASLANMAKPTYAAAYKEPYKGWRHQPSGLFNAMIRPLDWFPIKGLVWYQGESDTTKSQVYGERLKQMIKGQRARRNETELPFIIIQLANHDPVARGKDPAAFSNVWAQLRDAQEEAASLPRTALVVTADVGNATNIHPRDKKTVGSRAADAALCLCDNSFSPASGPVLDSLQKESGELRLRFKSLNGGLVIERERATGSGPDFEIAGSDGVYHPAEAMLSKNEVVVSSPRVSDPFAVRYAFHNNPKLILYDEKGFPARPFHREVSAANRPVKTP
jgi:sialate O-acetylesterase